MGQSRRVFTRKVTPEAVNLVTDGGHSTAQVSRDLGITPNLLRRRTQAVTDDPVTAFPCEGRRKPHDEELTRFTREWGDARAGFFKKVVAAYFAKPSA